MSLVLDQYQYWYKSIPSPNFQNVLHTISFHLPSDTRLHDVKAFVITYHPMWPSWLTEQNKKGENYENKTRITIIYFSHFCSDTMMYNFTLSWKKRQSWHIWVASRYRAPNDYSSPAQIYLYILVSNPHSHPKHHYKKRANKKQT